MTSDVPLVPTVIPKVNAVLSPGFRKFACCRSNDGVEGREGDAEEGLGAAPDFHT